MAETLYEGIYLLKTREFVNSKQEIYKIGRSNNLSTRVLNYPNKSVVYLMIECIDSPKHEKYLIKLFTSKYKQECEYGKEYFSGVMTDMKDDIVNYIKPIMISKKYKMINDTIILDRKTFVGDKTLYRHQMELTQCIINTPIIKKQRVYNRTNNKTYNQTNKVSNEIANDTTAIDKIANEVVNEDTANDAVNKVANELVNKKIDKTYICNICDKEFNFPYLLDRHKKCKRKCKPVNEKLRCNKCHLYYVNKYSLAKHKCGVKQENIINNEETTILQEEIKSKNINNNQNIVSKNKNTINNTVSTSTNTLIFGDKSIDKCFQNKFEKYKNSINHEINPFGYEDDSFLTDAECMELLIMLNQNNIIPIIKKIYSNPKNCNFIKNNINKDIITLLNDTMNISTYLEVKFYDMLIKNTINFLKRLFVRLFTDSDENLLFYYNALIIKDINDICNIYKNKDKMKELRIYLDVVFRHPIIKKSFKEYVEKLVWDTDCNRNSLERIKGLKYKNLHIYNNFNSLIISVSLLVESNYNPSDVDDFLEENTLELEDTPKLEEQSFSANVDSIVATNIDEPNVLEQSKQSEQLPKEENKIHTHEELLAQGYVLDADGDYVKKIPKWKFNRKVEITSNQVL